MDPSENPAGRSGTFIALAMACALAAPFVSRWLAGPGHGDSWMASYLSNRGFVFGWSCVHACTLLVLGRARAYPFTAFRIASAASIAFATYAHSSVDLTSSSTAVLALVWIPIWASVGALIVWVVIGLAMKSSRAGG